MSYNQRTHKTGSSAEKKSSSSKTSTTSSSTRPLTPSLHSPARDYIMHLQRTIGNRAVEHLWKSGWLQRKLNIGPANDKYELEADAVAEKVVSMNDSQVGSSVVENSAQRISRTPLVDSITPLQRKCTSCEKEEAQKTPTEEDEGQMQKSPDLSARERDLQRKGLIPLKIPGGCKLQTGVN